MRFHIALVLASGSAAAAGPNITNICTVLQENLHVVPQLPETCSLAACLNLTAQLTCIANAIANGDLAALQKCLTTSMSQICSCVACFPMLSNILIALGVCPVAAPPPPPADGEGEVPEEQPRDISV
ncbi:uncharacterized protein N7529_009868 [Penicillium soppii]|uniref:uncharacterized protein n=1 Tax=Penicillium soppii TaxID=69789 RepID=UPI002546804A|nr:uncharacterized protein N7529_009868 [Penicillium soppii]KAJ5855924.1 hypothetical protein N7529_009868 [Penicillium soppii]